jgi:hypothetical protein
MRIKGFLDPADAIVPCKTCGAVEGEPCRLMATVSQRRKIATAGLKLKPLKKGIVHFSRRLSRLLLTARRPDLRESLEREAVKMLKEHLKEKRV